MTAFVEDTTRSLEKQTVVKYETLFAVGVIQAMVLAPYCSGVLFIDIGCFESWDLIQNIRYL